MLYQAERQQQGHSDEAEINIRHTALETGNHTIQINSLMVYMYEVYNQITVDSHYI